MFEVITLGKIFGIVLVLIVALFISRTRDTDATLFFIVFWLSMGILKDYYVLIGIFAAMLLLFRSWIVAFVRHRYKIFKTL
ncbi:hypothetical protein HY967_03450 [Candidatus Jorgensenbacteria bacterium]|nr:hypothetical protein [Candidatus Jorgensenbacteria bacterium]